MSRRALSLSLAALVLAFSLPSCGLLPFQRSATLEISFSIPDEAPAPAGFIAAVLDELAAQEPGSRVFDPATAFIRAVITTPDIPRPIVLAAPYESGPVSMRIVAPVGERRHLTVTALDAERSELTRGELDFEVREGLNELTLWMKPVEELLPAERAVPLGPVDMYAYPPTGGLELNSESLALGTSYYYAELPVDGVYRFSLEASPPPGSTLPTIRLYDDTGRRVHAAKADSAFPGRVSLPAGKLYIVVDNPLGDFGVAYLAPDLDWRPSIISLNALGEQDSRDPLVLEFPNELKNDQWEISFPAGISFYEYSDLPHQKTGKILTITPPIDSQGSWYAPVSTATLEATFTDPLLSTEAPVNRSLYQLLGWQSIPVYTFVYFSPTGNDAGTGRPDNPFKTLGASARFYAPPNYSEVCYILAAGVYDEPFSVDITENPRVLGGWTQPSAGGWVPNPEGWTEIRMGGNSAEASFNFMGCPSVEGIIFKHKQLTYASGGVQGTAVNTVSIGTSSWYGTATFTRCRFYSPGMNSAVTTDKTLYALNIGGMNPTVLDRCSVNWPEDLAPETRGGFCNRSAAAGFMSHDQAGIYVDIPQVEIYNSVLAAGSIIHAPVDVFNTESGISLNALKAGFDSYGISLYGSTLLGGMGRDLAGDIHYGTDRSILTTQSALTALNCLFHSEAPLPTSDQPFYGIKTNEAYISLSTDYCAFAGLFDGTDSWATDLYAIGAPSFAPSKYMVPGDYNYSVSVAFAPSLRPLSGTVLDITAKDLAAGNSGEFAERVSHDFYGAPRGPSWSVGAVEYR